MKTYIFGKNTVRDALSSVEVFKVYLAKGLADERFINDVKKAKVPYELVDNNTLSRMVKGNHQGIVAEVNRYEYSSLEEIVRISKGMEHPIVLLLDGIKDPGNFGAILRSCDAFSVAGIIIKKHGQVMINSTVAKTSTGAINHVKVAMVANLSNALEALQKEGFWSVATDGMAKQNYDQVNYDFPVALVIGSEGEGISPLVLKRCEYKVKVPMTGHVNSLNASVATGIFLAHIRHNQSIKK